MTNLMTIAVVLIPLVFLLSIVLLANASRKQSNRLATTESNVANLTEELADNKATTQLEINALKTSVKDVKTSIQILEGIRETTKPVSKTKSLSQINDWGREKDGDPEDSSNS